MRQMGLKETQILFTRLCVDAAFRDQIFSNESGVEGVAFHSLEKEVRRQARSLVNKRLGVVKDILSGTCAAMGSAFAEEFRDFAVNTKEPQGVNRHRLDALAFVEWLSGSARSKPLRRPFFDLLKHEITPVQMWTKGRRSAFRFHLHPPRRLLDLAQAGILPNALPLRPCLLLWMEGNKNKRGYFWREFSPWC
ncbi:MAG: hypothetical protein HN675_04780 [Opitutae bacterium]|jgi:hypothetical protein|nr:hypothetical protein [Opitutae bacterium]MBT7852614.1 hypothetical protein [Opitutae bacterium]